MYWMHTVYELVSCAALCLLLLDRMKRRRREDTLYRIMTIFLLAVDKSLRDAEREHNSSKIDTLSQATRETINTLADLFENESEKSP